jgi:GAF domain-containing protein
MLQDIPLIIRNFFKRIWLNFKRLFSPVDNLPTVPILFNEKERQRLVEKYQLNQEGEAERYQQIVEKAHTICETPIALLSIMDNDRQFFKANVGLAVNEAPRNQAFCGFAVLEPYRILEIEDTTLEPQFYNNPLVLDDPNIKFYAGIPLVSSDGVAFGTLCVLDIKPRKLTEDQKRQLKLFAQELIIEIFKRD